MSEVEERDMTADEPDADESQPETSHAEEASAAEEEEPSAHAESATTSRPEDVSGSDEASVSSTDAERARVIPKVGNGDPVICARRLSLWYGQIIGINDISIDIGTGVLGLLGPNGAGKSTFLKVVTGQLRPMTGTVAIRGRIVWNDAETMSRLGFVPEQDAFYEDMTGRDFVTYLTQLQGYDKQHATELAAKAIEKVQLTEQADRYIREYSKGMRQRIKIAQALAHEPDVLVLDEPLAGTDPVGRRHIINLIKQLGDEGKTVLVSSHILHEVEQMTQNIMLINHGRILADGDIYRIREMIDEHPHTIFVDCDAPRRFAALLAEHDDVVSIEFLEVGFQLSTRDPDACYTRIPKVALEHGISVRRLTSPDNNLTAVFNYLVQ